MAMRAEIHTTGYPRKWAITVLTTDATFITIRVLNLKENPDKFSERNTVQQYYPQLTKWHVVMAIWLIESVA
jgi:hypothetical protein